MSGINETHLYPLAVANILDKAWKTGISLQSQYFRDNPKLVALAASLGLITTIDSIGDYGNTWRISPRGLAQLFNQQEIQYEINNLESDAMETEASAYSPVYGSPHNYNKHYLHTLSPIIQTDF